MKKHARFWLAASVLLSASALLAYDVGDKAYTKKLETALLGEPKPFSNPVAKIDFAAELNVEQVSGAWLLVSAGENRGWVFAGNVAAKKPSGDHKADFLPASASDTTASIAARPLDDVAKGYGDQKGLGEAKDDVEWVEQQSAQVNDAAVTAYLQAKKLGEYK
jgi:hypothetical protein